MLSQRSSHYWLWFLLFGVVSSIVVWTQHHALDSESTWLLVTGFLGVLLGGMRGRLARPYDLVVGLLFVSIGVLGVLHNFGVNLVAQNATAASAIDQSFILGLSLALPFALIHLLLGLTSLNNGLRTRAATQAVTVQTANAAA
ncbi:MAG TPA: hypothetical protein VIG77_04275 [Ktedonobacterales bacterium]|jgi:hypothetical protein